MADTAASTEHDPHVEHAEVTAEQAVEHSEGHVEAAGEHLESVADQVGEAHGAAGGIPELPNVITVLNNWKHGDPLFHQLHIWENVIFSAVVGAFIIAVAFRYARKPSLVPGGGQNLIEALFEGIDSFVQRVIGPAASTRLLSARSFSTFGS
jgi:F0F1-type ATP synthase membrane subunit a